MTDPTPSGLPQPQTVAELTYAQNLAKSIFESAYKSDPHYASGQVVWECGNDLITVLTQIDNMVSGMVRLFPAVETVAVQEAIQRLIDLRHDEETRDHEIIGAIDALEAARRLAAPLPVAPKAEPTSHAPEHVVNRRGELIHRDTGEKVQWPAPQPVVADTLTDEQEVMHMVYDYARISDGIDRAEGDARRQQLAAMRAKANEIRAALASPPRAIPAEQAAPTEPLTESYVQQVPDHCDRITWKGRYYHLPPGAAHPHEAADRSAEADAVRLDDLAHLTRKLARALRKAAPDNDLPAKALDYLDRKGLKASILRSDDADEEPSEKQRKLLELADRIDHERLCLRPGMFHRDMTPEQRDRMNAGVELRRYAQIWKANRWIIVPPVGPVRFSAETLDKAVDMAKRDAARRRDAAMGTPAAAEPGKGQP